MAQLEAQHLDTVKVAGSNPVSATTGAWSNGMTLALQVRNGGSIPPVSIFAAQASMERRCLGMAEVSGSIPECGSLRVKSYWLGASLPSWR